jgi:hypothetical protein
MSRTQLQKDAAAKARFAKAEKAAEREAGTDSAVDSPPAPVKAAPAARARVADPVYDEETGLPFSKEELEDMSVSNLAPEQTVAALLMESIIQRGKKEQDDLVREREKGKVYYVKCRFCPAPGLFFSSNPGLGPFTADQWFASYKPLNLGWQHGQMPHCQNCNRELPLKRCQDGQSYKVIKRFLANEDSRQHRKTVMPNEQETTA